jgi:AcrR family transcriptional regulator
MTMSATGTSSPEQACAMRADARRNHERLLAAAAATFAEHAADDASLEEIARRAGVGMGTLYRHFPTRQALLEAVYRDQAEALHAGALELLNSPSPGEALAVACEYASPHADQADRLLSLMFDGLRSPAPGPATPNRLSSNPAV